MQRRRHARARRGPSRLRRSPSPSALAERARRAPSCARGNPRASTPRLRALGAFQRAQLRTRARGRPRDVPRGRGRPTAASQRLAAAAASTDVPGRLQLLGGDPPTLIDGAHNPAAVAALVESLPKWPRPPAALVLGVLEDKDAAAMLAALLPLCEARVVHGAAEQPRALARGAAVARAPARLRGRRRASRGPRVPSRARRVGE